VGLLHSSFFFKSFDLVWFNRESAHLFYTTSHLPWAAGQSHSTHENTEARPAIRSCMQSSSLNSSLNHRLFIVDCRLQQNFFYLLSSPFKDRHLFSI
jgi:hypothetical protein